jgi:hypothetical protein
MSLPIDSPANLNGITLPLIRSRTTGFSRAVLLGIVKDGNDFQQFRVRLQKLAAETNGRPVLLLWLFTA